MDPELHNEVIFVTHANINYASRVIALIQSMQGWSSNYKTLVFCHDFETIRAISHFKFPAVELLHLGELEAVFPELSLARKNRSEREYFFCLTPFILRFLENHRRHRFLVYIDADLYFFSDPIATLNSISKSHLVTIVPHRFSKENIHLEQFGKYNVGWMAFQSMKQGNPVLKWWMQRCLESTSTVKDSKYVYGDQKYLDQFILISPLVGIDENINHNVGPWNVKEFISKSSNIAPTYYHFSGFKKFGFLIIMNLRNYGVVEITHVKEKIYSPYARVISEIERELRENGLIGKSRYEISLIWRSIQKKDFFLIVH